MWKKRVLGVELGTRAIKVVQLSIGPGSKKTLSRAALLEQPEELASLLRDKEWVRPSEPIHVGFPSDRVIAKAVDLPFRDAEKILRALPFELEGDLPFSAEEIIVGYVSRGSSGEQGSQVMAFAAPKEAVKGHLDTCTRLGVNPWVLEPEVLGLARFCRDFLGKGLGELVALNVGATRTDLVAQRDGVVVSMRSIPQGLEDMGNPEGWELIKEVKRALRSLTSRGEINWPKELHLCGGIVEDTRAVELLTHGLGMEPRFPDISNGLGVLGLNQSGLKEGRLCVALGLALHGSDGWPGASNLRAGELEYRPGLKAMRGRVWAAALLTFFALTSGLAWLEVEVGTRQKRLAALQGETKRLFREAFPQVTQVVDPALQMQRMLDERKNRYLALLAQDPKTTAVELLRDISLKVQTKTIRITELDLSGESVNIRGEATSYEVVEKAKDQWSTSALLESVEVKNAKKNPKTQLWDFQCSAKRRSS